MPIPIIGRRQSGSPSAFGVKYDVVIAEKQKMLSPSGKREKVIVFSRVPQSRLNEDTTGNTRQAAKRAVMLMRDKLEKSGLPKEKIKLAMQNMYAVDQQSVKNNDMKTMRDALDGRTLDVLLDRKVMKSGKVRFSDTDASIPTAPARANIPMGPIELPPLPDLPDLPDE